MKKNILVTGALGHIGSKLIRYLPKYIDGNFILIDNFYAERYCSLFNLPNNVSYEFYDFDINKVNLNNFIKKKIDIVIHLAAFTDATKSLENKKKYLENNLGITKKILEFCKKKRARLIYISSTSIYGTQKKIVNENCRVEDLKPQSPYAISKFAEEKLINKYDKKYKLKNTILRFGTIFGVSEGMRFHTAVNKFCYQASKKKKITVWKTALYQKRPYLDLIDGVRSILFVIENNLFDGEIYNVLTHNLTVNDIVLEIKKKYIKQKIKFVNSPIMNQLSYEVSTKKFLNEGFVYKGNISKGIMKTLKLLELK